MSRAAMGAFVGVPWFEGRLIRALEGTGDIYNRGVVGRWPRIYFGLLAFSDDFGLVLLPSIFLQYNSNTTPMQHFFASSKKVHIFAFEYWMN